MVQKVFIPGVGYRKIGDTPTVDINYSLDGEIHYSITNTSTGTHALSAFVAGETTTFGDYGALSWFNTNYSGTLYQYPKSIQLNSTGSGGLTLHSSHVTQGKLRFVVGDLNSASSLKMTLDVNGNLDLTGSQSITATAFSSRKAYLTLKNSGGFAEIKLTQGQISGYGGVLELNDGLGGSGYMRMEYNGGYLQMITNQTSFSFIGTGFSGRWTNAYIDFTTSGITYLTLGKGAGATILTGAASAKGLIVKGAASQTANLQEWQNSSGTALTSINAEGCHGINRAPVTNVPLVLQTNSSTSDGFYMYNNSGTIVTDFGVNAGGHLRWRFRNSASTVVVSINTDGATGGAIDIVAPSASAKGIVVKAAASHTANLLEVQNSSSVVITSIDKNGGIVPASMTDATAANSTLYYSTTANKLVYKDSGGIVNALY